MAKLPAASSQHERRPEESEPRTVTVSFDSLSRTELSAEAKHRLQQLAEMHNSEIDLSDIPELPAGAWDNAISNPYLKIQKDGITVSGAVRILTEEMQATLASSGRNPQHRKAS